MVLRFRDVMVKLTAHTYVSIYRNVNPEFIYRRSNGPNDTRHQSNYRGLQPGLLWESVVVKRLSKRAVIIAVLILQALK